MKRRKEDEQQQFKEAKGLAIYCILSALVCVYAWSKLPNVYGVC